jgi:hypothetical protein
VFGATTNGVIVGLTIPANRPGRIAVMHRGRVGAMGSGRIARHKIGSVS